MTRKGRPTQPNRTKVSTASDKVYTDPETATWIINYFKPEGVILDPCAGKDAFYSAYPKNCIKHRCEIEDNLDFFEWVTKVDWIITNPPYSIYDHFLQHAFEIAENVVFFAPLAKAFKSNKVHLMVSSYGGLKSIVYMGSGAKHGFGFGFPVGCLYYRRNYRGSCKIVSQMDTI